MNITSESTHGASWLNACAAAVVIALMNPVICLAQESVPLPADPAPSWSANIRLSSDYLFRGISQTEGPAVSGGFDWASPALGIYAGVWASNVDFGDEANIEIDYYGGISGGWSQGPTWDIGAIYYDYPGADLNDYIEAYGALNYSLAGFLAPEIGIFVAWSPDFFAQTGRAIYVNPMLEMSISRGLGLNLSYGYQSVDDLGDYSHASIELSKQLNPYTFSLKYNSNFDTSDFCGLAAVCDDTLVFSVSSTF